MDTDWCLGCETHLTREPVYGGYCSTSCYHSNSNDAHSYRHQPVFESSSSSDSEDDDDDEQVPHHRQPSTSVRPASRVGDRIRAWAASVPACAGHPHLLPPPPPPVTTLGASLQGFSRPALLRRHSALKHTPPSTFVSKTRPVPTSTSPSSSPLRAHPRPSAPHPYPVGSPGLASSFLAPPTRVLNRIRSWVRSDASSSTATTPIAEEDESTPKLVTLDDAASTSTLVGEMTVPTKAPEEWVSASPAATLPAEELSRLVLAHRHRHRATRGKSADGPSLPPSRIHTMQFHLS